MGGSGNGSGTKPEWGSRCDERWCSLFPLQALVPVTAVCLALLVAGVAGNALTVLLVCRCRELRSTTGLYLGSMAVADLLLLLLGLPFDLYRLWRWRPWVFGPALCRLLLYVAEACPYCTILHLTALAAERYLAICFPLRARRLVTRPRVKALIAALWAFALLSAAPFFFLVGLEQPDNRTSLGFECKATRHAVESGLLSTMLWVTTSYFLLPAACLSLLYGLVGRQLLRTKLRTRGPNASAREREHRQTIRILVVVVVAFVICWLPFHVGRIIYINSWSSWMMHFSQYFNIFALHLFYLSASINPILYNFISKKYRAAAYKLLLTHQSGQKAFTVIRDAAGYTETSASIKNEFTVIRDTAGYAETNASIKKEFITNF
uniref:Growth hormone secretagogue receptor type 1 n=1 Tax=Sphenodon punctatus TaxID=8508 RepID=A0A8D0GRF7_SPHPU